MKKVSHHEFTRVKNKFGKNHIHFHIARPRTNYTPNDDWVNITWRLNGGRDDLFTILEKRGEKEYFVSDEAYKILHILEEFGLTQEPSEQTYDGISW